MEDTKKLGLGRLRERESADRRKVSKRRLPRGAPLRGAASEDSSATDLTSRASTSTTTSKACVQLQRQSFSMDSAIGTASASASASNEPSDDRSLTVHKEDESAVAESIAPRASYGSLVIRSYLHKFYEPSPFDKDRSEEAQPMLHTASSHSCSVNFWRAGAWTGCALILAGLVLILVGYSLPRRQPQPLPLTVSLSVDSAELPDNDDDNSERERERERERLSYYYNYNYRLEVCKLSGLALFCFGATCAVVSLLVPTLMRSAIRDDASVTADSDSTKQPPGFDLHHADSFSQLHTNPSISSDRSATFVASSNDS